MRAIRSFAIAAASLCVFLTPGAASSQQGRSAALAIDRRDGERYGWAVDYETQAGADQRALDECGRSSEACHVVLRFTGGCGAYVVERGNSSLYGWGTSDNRGAAEARARQEAASVGGRDLVLRVWGCNSSTPEPPASEAERLRRELEAVRLRRAEEAAEAARAEQARLQEQLRDARTRREQQARDEVENGRMEGRVTDALTRNGIAGATLVIESGAGSSSTATSADGAYRSELLPPGVYRLTAVAEGYQSATLHGATIGRAETTTLASIPLVPASDQPGVISGAVRNARNATPMGGVQVQLRSGVGSTAGAPVAVASSNAAGLYRFPDLGAGTYSVTAAYPEFVAGGITGISVGGSEVPNQDVLMSPEGTENELRIVLSWGAQPADLDSHLFGPSPSGGRFHISYNARGSLTGSPEAGLDVDDTSSFGPETITIVRQGAGPYRYAVHHYSGSSTVSQSGAVVQLYRGATLLARFEPPAGGSGRGDVWTVFEIQGTTIRRVNTLGRSLPN